MRRIAVIAIVICFSLGLVGCNRQITNSVGADEYEIYSNWLKFHFAHHPPAKLYIRARTITAQIDGCRGADVAIRAKTGRFWTPLKQFRALETAEYSLELVPPNTKLNIPWSYTALDDWQGTPDSNKPFRLIFLSRVAFNFGHDKALFDFADVPGIMGGYGGTVFAHKGPEGWVFESVGCSWIS